MPVMQPICLHPDNSRYFLFRGKPTVLVTSTEHYGAVINTAFDYIAYLDMLQSYGFNLTRICCLLRETESEFKGMLGYRNTLAPRPERYVGPWKRGNTPGHLDGGNKLDLDQWDQDFFTRLRDFCAKASERGIIVEVTMFSQYYNNKPDGPWTLCPLNPLNNECGQGAEGYNRFMSCDNKQLLAWQESMARKVVSELAGYDNVYFEICNEPPYPQQERTDLPEDHPEILGEKAISEWQNRIAEAIGDEEARHGAHHMVAVGDPHEHIDFNLFSVFNYHYREWAESGLNRHQSLNKAQAMDETLTGMVSWNWEMHFDERRKEAWEFFLRGFAVYDYLDMTVATEDPRGEGNVAFPDGHRYDGTMMRIYLKHLKDFFDGIDFIHMKPDDSVIGSISDTAKAWALGGKDCVAVYICGSALKFIQVSLPMGAWNAEWSSPVSGGILKTQKVVGGEVLLELPLYQTDIALRTLRLDDE